MSSLKRKAAPLDASDPKKPKSTVNSSITSFFSAPKSAGGAAPRVKFDKKKWAEKLTPEQRELLKLEIETLDESWLAHLKDDVVSNDFLELKRFLKREKEAGKVIFPPEKDIYSWSRYTPLHTVKAVILGQDPYHNHNQAHGLCFSVRAPIHAPPSLKNIYTALRKDYPSFTPPPKNGGLLTPWAENGVLLLNTCLTVRAHDANSHSQRGWEKFTGRVIEIVSKVRTRGVVFLAWGTPAAKRVAKVDRRVHHVLQSVHPSPLSAMRGFFDCGHFKKANVWLRQKYGPDGEIDWNLGTAVVEKPPTAPVDDEFPFDDEIPPEEDLIVKKDSSIKDVKKDIDAITSEEEEALNDVSVQDDGQVSRDASV
ncbi:hypothetical protein FGG08_006246 [Glutinoglossum americanum]|uniref:Uracil-DNA glycosylase n=1 Tax=Glutinoglossum americanum TaxID=1670608 RepID=A0A9P8I3U2_9PEZI|nr:hypothetical protein FGG08_006246 [Glutinoglossum americanum]